MDLGSLRQCEISFAYVCSPILVLLCVNFSCPPSLSPAHLIEQIHSTVSSTALLMEQMHSIVSFTVLLPLTLCSIRATIKVPRARIVHLQITKHPFLHRSATISLSRRPQQRRSGIRKVPVRPATIMPLPHTYASTGRSEMRSYE